MDGIFDIYNIIFLVIAIMILFRLRSVLGRRTGNERPPSDPYSVNERKEENSNENVKPAPNTESIEEDSETVESTIDQISTPGTTLNDELKKISGADESFKPDEFVQGAKLAYEMIVTAYAKGDRKALKDLLSTEVYGEFVSAISDRESNKETVDFTFVGLESAKIVDASLKRKTAQIVIRFKSQLISANKNEDGAVVSGDPNQVSTVTDIWTFSRVVSSNNPNWKLVATDSTE